MGLDLDAIRERADAATKGPWHVEYCGERGYPQRVCNDAAVTVADTHWGGGGLAPDAEFIAHAREDVPALLAEIQQLRAELEAVRGVEQWAALYRDGDWTSGETWARDEAEEIINRAGRLPEPLRPVLARRRVTDWQRMEGEDR